MVMFLCDVFAHFERVSRFALLMVCSLPVVSVSVGAASQGQGKRRVGQEITMLQRTVLLGLAVLLVSGGAAYANFVDGFEVYQNPGPGNGYELSVLSGGVWTAKNVSAGLSDPDYSEPARTGVMARSNRGTGQRGDERPIGGATYTEGVVSVESWQMLSDLNATAGELHCGTGFSHDDGYNKQR